MSKNNGKINCENYRGTLVVYAPEIKWYHFSVPYTSEMERVLEPAINYEEEAIIVAPNKFTATMLKIESFGPNIPVVMTKKEAHKLIDTIRSSNGSLNGDQS